MREFIAREVAPHINAWDEAGSFPRELYRKASEIGLLGMGWTLVIAIGLTALSLGHLLTIPIPEVPPTRHESDSAGHFDVRSALEAIQAHFADASEQVRALLEAAVVASGS